MGQPTVLNEEYTIKVYRKDLSELSNGGKILLVKSLRILILLYLFFSRLYSTHHSPFIYAYICKYFHSYVYIDTYDPLEELTVKLFPKIFQAAFEIRGE